MCVMIIVMVHYLKYGSLERMIILCKYGPQKEVYVQQRAPSKVHTYPLTSLQPNGPKTATAFPKTPTPKHIAHGHFHHGLSETPIHTASSATEKK